MKRDRSGDKAIREVEKQKNMRRRRNNKKSSFRSAQLDPVGGRTGVTSRKGKERSGAAGDEPALKEKKGTNTHIGLKYGGSVLAKPNTYSMGSRGEVRQGVR